MGICNKDGMPHSGVAGKVPAVWVHNFWWHSLYKSRVHCCKIDNRIIAIGFWRGIRSNLLESSKQAGRHIQDFANSVLTIELGWITAIWRWWAISNHAKEPIQHSGQNLLAVSKTAHFSRFCKLSSAHLGLGAARPHEVPRIQAHFSKLHFILIPTRTHHQSVNRAGHPSQRIDPEVFRCSPGRYNQ